MYILGRKSKMLKTIKTTKKLNLHELIKYVWENPVKEKMVFHGSHDQRVVFDNVGGFYPSGYAYSPDTTFSVEIEEEITEDTKFDLLLELCLDDGEYRTYSYINRCIGQLKDSNTVSIYALINEKLELIWERDDHGSN